MSHTSITNRKEFLKQLPPKLQISASGAGMFDQIILTDSLNTSDIHIPSDTRLTFIALLQKGWEETQVLNFHCDGQNSKINFIAFILAKDSETFPFETISNHTVPNTNGYYTVRGAMFDKSQVNYRGQLNIRPKAQITDSYLAHHTLMLSEDAKVNTIPSLEIEADDVKAGHAATIGKVDEDMLFYLTSRGISKKEAEQLLIQGFIEVDLKKIPDEEIQKILATEIENSLCLTRQS